jgi:Rrf2 family protein
MKLSSRGQYAIQAMIDIATHSARSKGPITLREIAKNQSIPLPFLEQIAVKLRKSGLIKSIRGASGGYMLLKDKKQISLSDIIISVEGEINIAPSTKNEFEVTKELWHKLNRSIYTILKSVTLEDLYYDSISLQALKENEVFI